MPGLVQKIEQKLHLGSSSKSVSSSHANHAPTSSTGDLLRSNQQAPNLVPETDTTSGTRDELVGPSSGLTSSTQQQDTYRSDTNLGTAGSNTLETTADGYGASSTHQTSSSTYSATSTSAVGGPVVEETYDRRTNAPVVKETVRDEYVHNVQPVIKEEVDRTEILHTVQPLVDNQVRTTDVTHVAREAQYQEVSADERLARETEEKLRIQREQLAAQAGRVHLGETHSYTENAPAVSHQQRVHVIEEVQPVLERDILRPHIVEERQDVYVHHTEAPVLKETRVAPVMNISEWERTQASRDESQVFDNTTNLTSGSTGYSGTSSTFTSTGLGGSSGTHTHNHGLGTEGYDAPGFGTSGTHTHGLGTESYGTTGTHTHGLGTESYGTTGASTGIHSENTTDTYEQGYHDGKEGKKGMAGRVLDGLTN